MEVGMNNEQELLQRFILNGDDHPGQVSVKLFYLTLSIFNISELLV